jgi:hypothetical protein
MVVFSKFAIRVGDGLASRLGVRADDAHRLERWVDCSVGVSVFGKC